MRRSLCPSQMVKREHSSVEGSNCSATANSVKKHRVSKNSEQNHGNHEDINDDIVIQRMPLFTFLEVPDNLRKEFRIPNGCKLSRRSIELRNIKSLGGNRIFKRVTPADLNSSLPKIGFIPDKGEDYDEEVEDEIGVCRSTIPPHEPLVLWVDENDQMNKVEVIPELASKLRPHQREGVQFLFECTMGLRGFEGNGCILADDMGLGFNRGESACKKVIVVCPTSLVGNWDNEIRKWVGDNCPTFPVKTDAPKIIKSFITHRGKGVLIISYETQRRYSKLFEKSVAPFRGASGGHVNNSSSSVCDLLICDEAHKLKNADSGLSKSLNCLPVKRRILLSGTPMQNELTEFFNMVDFCNPNVLGNLNEFRKRYERPILASREPDASDEETAKAGLLQKELSTIVNEFILKRGNILNAQHLPPKLVQFVCCRLSPAQTEIYDTILNTKEVRHIREGKQTDTLGTLRQLINVCSHPRLVWDSCVKSLEGAQQETSVYNDAARDCSLDDDFDNCKKKTSNSKTKSVKGKNSLDRSDEALALMTLLRKLGVVGAGRTNGTSHSSAGSSSMRLTQSTRNNNQSSSNVVVKKHGLTGDTGNEWLNVELSGKLYVLFRMMQTLRAMKQGERIVIVSNYTQTLDLIEKLCRQNQWPMLRLDGSVTATTRTKLVDQFNDPFSNQFAFLLSSKAGGCGINLIGGSRLVLFDPDWNPACDKQAAGRIWREGQKRRCYIYRFMSTNTVEEKIIQRQLSKEGLQNIVDDTDQVNVFSTEELKRLFIRREDDTPSDTHDTLRCQRCLNVCVSNIQTASERNKLVPPQVEALVAFITELHAFLSSCAAHSSIERSFEDISNLATDLHNELYATLPVFSRKLRDTVYGIERELVEENLHHSIMPQGSTLGSVFSDRWNSLVPKLSKLGKEYQKALNEAAAAARKSSAGSGSGDEADNEVTGGIDEDYSSGSSENELQVVEQEGCPEESDFNKWSHHSSVATCDDEVLKLALADDNTVSFVFGLEVNWSLLKLREEETKELREVQRENVKRELQELNLRRKLLKEKKLNTALNSDDDDSDHEDNDDDDDDDDQEEEKLGMELKVSAIKVKTTKSKPKFNRTKPIVPPVDSSDSDSDIEEEEEEEEENNSILKSSSKTSSKMKVKSPRMKSKLVKTPPPPAAAAAAVKGRNSRSNSRSFALELLDTDEDDDDTADDEVIAAAAAASTAVAGVEIMNKNCTNISTSSVDDDGMYRTANTKRDRAVAKPVIDDDDDDDDDDDEDVVYLTQRKGVVAKNRRIIDDDEEEEDENVDSNIQLTVI